MARAAGILLRATTLLWTPLHVLGQSSPRDVLQDFLTFPLQNVTPSAQAPDDLFTIVFIADSEPRMRANTDNELRAYIRHLVSYKTSRAEYFNFGGGSRYRVDPELVILAGDISADRETSIAADAHLWQPLAESGIALIAGFGNHDWTGTNSYDFSGDSWNAKATEFCRQTYRDAARVAAPHFGYREFGPSDSRGPVTFLATYRGVQIVNFNSFLYQPSYHYDFESSSGRQCAVQNAASGWAGCQVFTSAEPQIQQLEGALDPDAGVATLFVQHYPLTTSESWWDDYGASRTSVAQKSQRLESMITRYSSAALLTGHNHHYTKVEYRRSGSRPNPFVQYVAPYFGGDGGADLNQGGGFLALLVSRRSGIVEVKHIPTPLYDPTRTTLRTTTSRAATTTGAPRPADTSILGRLSSRAQAQACIVDNCIFEAVACSGDSVCSRVATPLIVSTGNSQDPQHLAQLAQLLWGLASAAPGNSAVRAIAACADRACGSAILSSRTTPPPRSTSAALRGTGTTTVAPSPPPSTTWNPWVAVPAGGCRRRGDGAARVAAAVLVATASFQPS